MSPSNRSETKQAPPCGVTPIKHLNVFVCLYEEYVFPCWAKSRDISTRNSVQSTIQRIFFRVLNTLGKEPLIWSLVGNIIVSMSLNILYITCMYVVKNFLMVVSFTVLSSELSNTAMVFTVNPLFNLRRHIKSFSLVENFDSFPLLPDPFSVLCPLLEFQYTSESSGQTLSRKLCSASTEGLSNQQSVS